MEAKDSVSAKDNGGQRGYVSFSTSEKAKGEAVSDVKEYYMMGRELCDEDIKRLGLPKNVWPDFCGFQKPANNFYNLLEEYSALFQEIFSLALGQKKDFLAAMHKEGDTSCRMIHYPVDKGQGKAIWAGAHTDIDTFTILPKATCKGLEVCDDNGNWIPVFIKGDAMIVNVGDFLEILSNGYMKSSLHRVKAPKNMEKDRYSCVHFVHPRGEAELYPLSQWVEKTGGTEKYIRATRNEMLWERLADLGLALDFMLKDIADWKLMERLMVVDRASPEAMKAVYDAGYASDKVKKALGVGE